MKRTPVKRKAAPATENYPLLGEHPLQKNLSPEVWRLFEWQVRLNKPVTDRQITGMANPHYFDGSPVLPGDLVLYLAVEPQWGGGEADGLAGAFPEDMFAGLGNPAAPEDGWQSVGGRIFESAPVPCHRPDQNRIKIRQSDLAGCTLPEISVTEWGLLPVVRLPGRTVDPRTFNATLRTHLQAFDGMLFSEYDPHRNMFTLILYNHGYGPQVRQHIGHLYENWVAIAGMGVWDYLARPLLPAPSAKSKKNTIPWTFDFDFDFGKDYGAINSNVRRHLDTVRAGGEAFAGLRNHIEGDKRTARMLAVGAETKNNETIKQPGLWQAC